MSVYTSRTLNGLRLKCKATLNNWRRYFGRRVSGRLIFNYLPSMDHNNEWMITVDFRGKKSIKVTLDHKDEKGIAFKVHGNKGYQIVKYQFEQREEGKYPIQAQWIHLKGESGKFSSEKERVKFESSLLKELGLIVESFSR